MTGVSDVRGLISIALAGAALAAGPLRAEAEERPEPVLELIHSDLPLYTFEWADLWPRSFHGDDEFGCLSRVPSGDWRFTPANGEEDDGYWDRYTNYGVFHCAAIFRTADERAELADAKWKYGFFVLIGKARVRSRSWELWALQKGMIPGSEYILLAREAGTPGRVESFRVLQRRCPPGRIREAKNLDIWGSRYCSIDSRAELLTLARRMLRRPPAGTLSRVGDAEEPPEAED